MAKLTTEAIEQNKVFYYQQELKSEEFNRLFSKTIPTGIYEGGEFTRVNNTNFTIAPFTVVIEDGDLTSPKDVAVRIRTTQLVKATISTNIALPLVVARFKWNSNAESNLEILQVSENVGGDIQDLHSKDIILGKLNFTSSGGVYSLESESKFVDYTYKQNSILNKDILKDNLYVRAVKSGENPKKVRISEGIIRTKNGIVSITGQLSPEISNTTSTSRVDYIYINEIGEIKIEIGTSTGNSLPYYGRKVIAEIRRGPNRNSILGSEIYNFGDVPQGTLNSNALLVNNVSNYFGESNITLEETLNLLYEKIIREKIEDDNVKTFINSNGIKISSKENGNSMILKPFGDNSNFSLTLTTSKLTKNPVVTLPNDNVKILKGDQVTCSSVAQTIDGVKTFTSLPSLKDGEKVLVASKDEDATPYKQTKAIKDDLNAHKNNKAVSNGLYANAPHGIVQGHVADNDTSKVGFDADKVDGAHKSTDGTLGASKASNNLISTQLAVKTYVDKEVKDAVYNIKTQGHSATTGSLKVAIKVNGNSFDGSSNLTVPANITSVSNNSNHYISFVSLNSSTNQALKVNSQLMFNPSTGELTTKTLYLTSSREKKENISKFNKKALDIINEVDVVNYNYKEDVEKTTHIGIISEDVPDEMSDKKKETFAFSDTVGLLLKAVQELSEEVEILKKKVAKLEEN